MRVRHRVATLALAAALAAGCTSSYKLGAADKAGGASTPAVLRLGFVNWTDNGADLQLLQTFAGRVSRLSGGRLRVRLVNKNYQPPDEEPRIAGGVRTGRFDLGWITTRRWDDLGVKSVDVFQAPFLFRGYRQLDAVARSHLAGRILDGLKRYKVVGLALVPRALLHPEGPRPLRAPSDYEGLQFLVARSRATDDLLAAFGARAVYTVDSVTAGPPGGVQPLRESSEVETANVVLAARVGTLFANRRGLERLSNRQRAALREAGREMVEQAIAQTPSEEAAARVHCRTGPIAMARPADLAALERAAEPVVGKLERDPETNDLIAKIRSLEASTPHDPPLVVPPACGVSTHVRGRRNNRLSPSILNGTYRYVLTKAAAVRFGPPADDPGNTFPTVVTWTLRDGDWISAVGTEKAVGTYTVTRDRIALAWPRVGYTNTFTYRRDRDGTLNLKPVLPMDRGDQFVWSAEPWRRIGPPARSP